LDASILIASAVLVTAIVITFVITKLLTLTRASDSKSTWCATTAATEA